MLPFSPAAVGLAAAVSVAAGGCPGGVIATDSGGPGADGGGTTDGGGGTTDGGGGGSTDAGGGGSDGGGSGAVCGGLAGTLCPATEYCDYPDGACGAADGTGTCEVRPDVCTQDYDPVCGCDGTTYGNACMAAGAGVDVSTLGNCVPPPGYFPCGADFCDVYYEYCNHYVDDTGLPDTWTCTPMPTCSTIGCSCVETAPPCAGICTEDATGGATYTCGGG